MLNRASRPIVLICVVFGGSQASSFAARVAARLRLSKRPMRVLERNLSARLSFSASHSRIRELSGWRIQAVNTVTPPATKVEMHVVDELRCVEKVKAAFWCSLHHVRDYCRGANLTGDVLAFYEQKRVDCLTMNEMLGVLNQMLEPHGSRRP